MVMTIELLQKTIKRMMEKDSPYLLHIITKKGAGFIPAEEERIKYHAISKIEPEKNSSKPKFQDIFGDWLCDKAETDKSLVGITPAMKEGSGMVNFEKEYPERFYDVAIAEQHSVTFAAGLSLEGLKTSCGNILNHSYKEDMTNSYMMYVWKISMLLLQ